MGRKINLSEVNSYFMVDNCNHMICTECYNSMENPEELNCKSCGNVNNYRKVNAGDYQNINYLNCVRDKFNNMDLFEKCDVHTERDSFAVVLKDTPRAICEECYRLKPDKSDTISNKLSFFKNEFNTIKCSLENEKKTLETRLGRVDFLINEVVEKNQKNEDELNQYYNQLKRTMIEHYKNQRAKILTDKEKEINYLRKCQNNLDEMRQEILQQVLKYILKNVNIIDGMDRSSVHSLFDVIKHFLKFTANYCGGDNNERLKKIEIETKNLIAEVNRLIRDEKNNSTALSIQRMEFNFQANEVTIKHKLKLTYEPERIAQYVGEELNLD